jgi:glyoxylase-like metal-dependent hydrolase (beta-lactamase superfamily II)
MRFSQLRDHIYRVVVEPEAVNVGLIVGDDACLLVDTGTSPAAGEAIRLAVAEVTDRPLTAVVCTHGHWDHAFGLGAFLDVETIGHEDAGSALHGREAAAAWSRLRPWERRPAIPGRSPGAARALAGDARRHPVPPTDVAGLPLPSTQLASIALRDLGQVTVEIAHFGRAHTKGDLIVAVPEAQTVFAGDLVETAGPPQFDEESSVDGWVKALDSLWGVVRPSTLVVPGHGDPAGAYEVDHQRAGLSALWGQAEWAFYQQVPEADVLTHTDLSWPWDPATAERAIALTYAELRGRGAKPKRLLPMAGLGL